jgi:hypothetical protein
MVGMVGCSLIFHHVNALVLPVPWVVGFCLYIEIVICILCGFLAPFWPCHHSFLVVWGYLVAYATIAPAQAPFWHGMVLFGLVSLFAFSLTPFW